MARRSSRQGSRWTKTFNRSESQEASKASPISIKPTEVSLSRTTLTGHQRVTTGLARPIQTCLLGACLPSEDQRSTRTDVTKLSRNRVELFANPPADVGFIRRGRMTRRRPAIGRLRRRTFPPTEVLLGGRDPAQGKEQATDSGHCLHRCSAVEQQQELLVFRRSSIERFLRSRSAWREGFLELEESTLTCIFASITIRQTQRSASHERSLAIHRLFDPGLEGVADQTGYQPTQRDMLLLGDSAKMAQEIVGQDNE